MISFATLLEFAGREQHQRITQRRISDSLVEYFQPQV